jgi:hypothetical protein
MIGCPVAAACVAMTLNNLGLLDGVQGWAEDGQQHFEEALKIRRELAQHNPDIYLRDVATTLNYLAPERARGDVQRIFQGTGHGAVVFGGDEKNRIGALDFLAKGDPRRGSVFSFEILVVEGQISDLGYFEFQWGGIQFDHGVRDLAIQRVLAKTPDQHNHVGDGVHGVAFPSGKVGSRGE